MKYSNSRTYKSNGCNLWIVMMYLTLNKLQAKKFLSEQHYNCLIDNWTFTDNVFGLGEVAEPES